MHKYVARRLLLMIPTLVALSLVIFGLMRILPGDVAELILGGGGEEIVAVSKESIAKVREELGLDRPLHLQYLRWMWGIVRGDLGSSLYTSRPIAEEIALRIPITLQIAIFAKLFSLMIGIPLGLLSAIKQGSFIDFVGRFFSIFFLGAPSFWLALMVILAGAMWFNWLPPLGYHPIWKDPVENLLQLMWPILILGLHGMAIVARLTRSTMLEVLREDYIRTARSKGLAENVVIIRHALKNALIPVVTVAGLSFGHLVAGTVILEYVFAIPGIGAFFIGAIQAKDFPVVQGLVVVLAVVFMTVNLVVDLLYGWLDPRISYS